MKSWQPSCDHEGKLATSLLLQPFLYIGAQLLRQHVIEMARNWKTLLIVLSCIKFFNLTELRHDISKSNHIQFLKYHGVEDGEFCDRLLKKINKYMLHEIQNSLIKVINSSFCILKV